jgi:hypothetical protein
MWSDPSDVIGGFQDSLRGFGCTFGVPALETFLANLEVKRLVRAHQCVANGVEEFGNGTGFTVFSCSNYHETVANSCGLLYANPENQLIARSLPPIRHIPRHFARFKQCRDQPDLNSARPLMALRRIGQQPKRLLPTRHRNVSLPRVSQIDSGTMPLQLSRSKQLLSRVLRPAKSVPVTALPAPIDEIGSITG